MRSTRLGEKLHTSSNVAAAWRSRAPKLAQGMKTMMIS